MNSNLIKNIFMLVLRTISDKEKIAKMNTSVAGFLQWNLTDKNGKTLSDRILINKLPHDDYENYFEVSMIIDSISTLPIDLFQIGMLENKELHITIGNTTFFANEVIDLEKQLYGDLTIYYNNIKEHFLREEKSYARTNPNRKNT